MRGADYDATLLVHAVKGKTISARQYASVKIGGRPQIIQESTKDLALQWFGEWAAGKAKLYGWAPKILVPIPNRSAVVGDRVQPRTALMAQHTARAIGGMVVVADILRWARKLDKSTNAASRKPEFLLPDLVLIGKPPKGQIILIDDVYTSGGHAVASAWRLEDAGVSPACLVACGRTLHTQLDDPFTVADEDLGLPVRPR